jgi:membrane peptidoglycan carboxypeptidase
MQDMIPILRARRERRLARMRKHEAGRRSAVLTFGMLVSLLLAALILLTSLAYAGLTKDLPSVEGLPGLLDPSNGLLLKPTQVYDRTGQHVLLAFGGDAPRLYVPLSESASQHIAPALPRLVVALSDPAFWRHAGYAIAGWRDPSLHPTIAQRLVSDLLLYGEKPSVRRAIRERILAAQVTARFGREQVLEWYLNSADFGKYAFGAEAAAQLYFDKSAADLSLAESAILAAVLQSPSLNPLDARKASIERGQHAIQDLQERGYLTDKEAGQALEERIRFQDPAATPAQPAAAFLNLALGQLQSRFSRARLERGGLSIVTTLDYDLQQQVSCITSIFSARMQGASDPPLECAQLRYLSSLPPGSVIPDGSASAIVIDPASGQVLAVAGETLGSQETALLAAHDPGSLMTPFVYLAGFTRGFSPATLVWDVPGLVDVKNFDGQYRGPMRLRTALANDYRVPAEAVRQQVGPENVDKIAASFSLPAESSLHLLELAGAYGVLGTQGVYYGQQLDDSFGPVTILRVDTADGQNWLNWSAPQARPVVTAGLAYLLTNILSDEPARWASLGTPNVLEIGRPVGVKPGQSAEGADAWTAGYSPSRVVLTWVGTRSESRVSIRFPAALWSALMQVASQDQPRAGWALPAGVSVMDVCDPSGLLPTADCSNIVSEVFLDGSEPTQSDTLYRSYLVNRETGQLATVFTPPQFVEKRVYMLVPPDAKSWAETAGIPVPPDSYDAIQPPLVNPEVRISAPALFDEVSGMVKITGTASGDGFDHYLVQVGKGFNPQEWIQVGGAGAQRIENGVLAEWDTSGLEGLYAVQLVVVLADQRVETAVTQVTVKNP